MQKKILIYVGISGALAVVLGAMGAHMLQGKLAPQDLHAYDTAVKYQFFHTLALIGIALLIDRYKEIKLFKTAAYLLMTGIIFFSGSIYLLATQGITGMHLIWLGPITPLGGLLFIAGWICFLLAATKIKQTSK